MFVVSQNSYRVGAGNNVTVYGGVFNANCVVNIDGVTVSPLDVAEDFVVFSAPNGTGTYSFTISGGGISSPAMKLVVVPMEQQATWRLPVRGLPEFVNMLVGLMPKGFAWNVRPGTNFYKLFEGVGAAILWLYNMLRDLVKEQSPVTTENALTTWENELGLPRKGMWQTTTLGRKNEVFRIARKKGGATVPYIKSLLDLYGAHYVLYEYWQNSSVFPAWVTAMGDQAKFCVLIKVYLDHIPDVCDCESTCEDALSNERDRVLESIIDHDKPAHIKVIYDYFVPVLTDENENVLTDEEDRLLIAG